MAKYTKDQKKEYFAGLRAQWENAKKLLTDDKIKVIDAAIATHGLNISRTGYMLVSMQMLAQDIDGIPYLDAKTYQGWKENGFQVKKGEKSVLGSITWIGIKSKSVENGDKVDKKGFMMPKAYSLFHRSQVEAA